MGLFGGKDEDELRASGTPTTARVTFVDDTGKRRENDRFAKLKVRVQIESGAARGRELDKDKWVPADRLPRVGDVVQIRFDPDHVDDWAWGDAAMYAPAAPLAPAAPSAPAVAPSPLAGLAALQAGGGFDPSQLQQMIATAFAQGNVTIEHMTPQVIDASRNPELRGQIMETLRQYGVDVEGIQGAQAAALAASGGVFGTPAAAAAGPASDDTSVRLRRVDELLHQGLISADEHREQRQRIIDSI